jgi:hypothetical protein
VDEIIKRVREEFDTNPPAPVPPADPPPPAPDDPPVPQAVPPVPPGGDPEIIKLQSELQAANDRATTAEQLNAAQATSAEDRLVREAFRLILADQPVIGDVKALRDVEDGLVLSGLFDVRDGKLVPKDPKQQPSDMVSGWLATRPWFLRQLPEGGGAQGGSPPGAAPPGGAGGSGFDPSKYVDPIDAMLAAGQFDRKRKG